MAARDENETALLSCVSWGLSVAVGPLLEVVVEVAVLFEGQPTPLYVARISLAACSATP